MQASHHFYLLQSCRKAFIISGKKLCRNKKKKSLIYLNQQFINLKVGDPHVFRQKNSSFKILLENIYQMIMLINEQISNVHALFKIFPLLKQFFISVPMILPINLTLNSYKSCQSINLLKFFHWTFFSKICLHLKSIPPTTQSIRKKINNKFNLFRPSFKEILQNFKLWVYMCLCVLS